MSTFAYLRGVYQINKVVQQVGAHIYQLLPYGMFA